MSSTPMYGNNEISRTSVHIVTEPLDILRAACVSSSGPDIIQEWSDRVTKN
ncbi:hypothetical protein [Aquimarina sp. 2304DJ70-9]|uniref:hypothetical protein n=1 Tax=Aquimarina penaris TaxID=3231044 RepID=UPI003461B4D3